MSWGGVESVDSQLGGGLYGKGGLNISLMGINILGARYSCDTHSNYGNRII